MHRRSALPRSSALSKLTRTVVGLLALPLLCAGSAFAATCTVTSTADTGAGTLRACIASANNGDTIDMSALPPLSVITLNSTIAFSQGLTIQGRPDGGVTISGGGAVQIFRYTPGTIRTLTIQNLVLASGSAAQGGAIYMQGGSPEYLSLRSVSLVNNRATGSGGAIYAYTFGPLTLNLAQVTMSGNVAPVNAALDAPAASYTTISQSTIAANSTGLDASGFNSFNASGSILQGYTPSANSTVGNSYTGTTPMLGPLQLNGSLFPTMLPQVGSPVIGIAGATTTDQRGYPGKSAGDAGAVQTHYVTVNALGDSNQSDTSAGTCAEGSTAAGCTLRHAVNYASTLTGTDITFAPALTSPNPALLYLGDLLVVTGVVDIAGPGADRLTLSSGGYVFGSSPGSPLGGLISMSSTARVAFNRLHVDNGYASTPGYGGNLYSAGVLTLQDVAASNGSALLGSGVYADSGSILFVRGSTFNTNYSAQGGTIGSQGGASIAVVDSTVADSEKGNGISLYNSYVGVPRLSGVTITNNEALYDAGGGVYSDSPYLVTNSIISGNSAPTAQSQDVGGAQPIDGGGNLINYGTTPADPQLAGLNFNGGPTQTRLPLPGSPALCVGKALLGTIYNTTTDQRGLTHSTAYCPSSQLDVGAVQTSYSAVSFIQQPTGTAVNATIAPAPTVAVVEGGQAVAGVSIPLAFGGPGSLNGTTTQTTAATSVGNVATFGNLSASTAATGDSLRTTLQIAGTYRLQATSNPFDIGHVPTVTGLSPVFGDFHGGTTVTVTGTNLDRVQSVQFGSVAGSITSYVSPTQIVVSSPAGTVDTVAHVTVSGTGGTSATSSADYFNFINATPVSINYSISPALVDVGSRSAITVAAENSNRNIVSNATFTLSLAPDPSTTGKISILHYTDSSGNFDSVETQLPSSTPPTMSVTSDYSGTVTFYVTSTAPLVATATTTVQNGNPTFTSPVHPTITFVQPSYQVTTLSDSHGGTAANCADLAVNPSGANTNCSLRDAITAANSQNAAATSNITFAPALTASATTASPAVITLMTGGDLNVTGSVNLVGPGANLLTIDANNASRIFTFPNTVSEAVSGLTLTGGNGSGLSGGGVGGAITSQANLTLSSISARANAAGSGGALSATGGSVTIVQSTFSANTAYTYGGALDVAVPLLIRDSTIYGNNSADRGGAIRSNQSVNISSSTIASNVATYDSGGIFASSVTATNSIISNNSAPFVSNVYGTLTGSGYYADNNLSSSPLDAKLSPLGYYGGPTQTLVPLPGSPVICLGTAANGAANNTATDQRGLTHSTAYCTASQLDAGAVQTSYSGVSFIQQPTSAAPNATITPAPTVAVTEGGQAEPGIPVNVTFAGTGTLNGTTTQTTASTAAGNLATFGDLSVNASGSGDTLNVSLPITASYALTAASNPFGIGVRPTITSVTPSSGDYHGGAGVAILGTNLDQVQSVHFGQAAGSIFYQNATQLDVDSPAGPLGSTVDITVTGPGGTSGISPVDRYTYRNLVSPTNSSLTVTPSTTDVGSSAVATLIVRDTAGNPIANSQVSLELDLSNNSETGTLSVTSPAGTQSNDLSQIRGTVVDGTTDSAGKIVYTITSTGRVTLTLSGTNTDSGTLAQRPVLNFVQPAYVVTTLSDGPANASLCADQSLYPAGANGSCSLRNAIAAANAQASTATPTITFAPGLTANATTANPAVMQLTSGDFNVTGSVNIIGPGANLLTIDAQQQSRIFTFPNTVNDTVSGLTLRNGSGTGSAVNGGGAIFSNTNLVLTDIAARANVGAGGGAIYANGGSLRMQSSTLSTNTSYRSGGALLLQVPTVLTDTTVSSNFVGGNSVNGGGIAVVAGSLTLTSSTVSANQIQGYGNGGGVHGTFTATNSIIAGNTAPFAANTDDTVTGTGNYFDAADNSNLDPMLGPLAYNGGSTQTQLPLPGSPVICLGTATNNTRATDQRGTAPSQQYGTSACVDAGSVQTHYALAFTQQPGNVVTNVAMSPAPTVTLSENAVPFTAASTTVTLAHSGTGTLSGNSANTSAAGTTPGLATFSSLKFNAANATDSLTASTALTAQVTATSGTSNTFNVLPAVAALAYVSAPSTTATAGATMGQVTVKEVDSNGNAVYNTGDTITLTVTGPANYSQRYTAVMNNSGLAVFNPATITVAGPYTYTASFTSATSAVASQTVRAGAQSNVTIVSGSPQSAAIGTAFTTPLKVLVKDAYGNPLSGGVDVSFFNNTGNNIASATFSPALATLQADGTAQTTATANGIAGTYQVSATAGGPSAQFVLTNTTGSSSVSVTAATATYGTATTSLSASVTYAGAQPTGPVTFKVDSLTGVTATCTGNTSPITCTASYNTASLATGAHTITVSIAADSNYVAASNTGTLTITKASSTLQAPVTANATYGTASSVAVQLSGPGSAAPTGTVSYTVGTGAAQTAHITAGAATVTIPANIAVGTYTITVSYAGDTNYTAAMQTATQLTVNKAAATVTLGSLTATYEGNEHAASAATAPAGLNVSFTYNGAVTIPAAAGSYAVIGTVVDANYTGSSSGTLVISKGSATVTLGSLNATYDGNAHAATATTNPAGLAVGYTYNGSATVPMAAGSYAVVGTVNDANYTGTTSGTLVIGNGNATVTLGSLAATYDGNPHAATATTTPANLSVSFTYNGSPTVPSAAGSYAVVAAITSPNYTGSASGTLVISKAAARIALSSLSAAYDGAPHAAAATTTPAGLNVIFAYNGSATAPTAAGSYAVVATVNNANYTGTANGTLVIAKGIATVALGSLTAQYDGRSHGATAATTPAGLNVTFAYNGSSTAPSAAGNYAVVATVNDANYTGTANGTLVINNGNATVTLAGLTATYDGTAHAATATTTPAGLNVTFTYNGSSTAPSAAGNYSVLAKINDPNYTGSASGTLVISNGTAAVRLGSLTANYDGSAHAATATTNPAGLNVSLTYNGSSTVPTAAGTYTVVATVEDPNYSGSTTGTLVIGSSTATVRLGSLAATYDGAPHAATATTTPTGLNVTLTYNGASAVPTAAGTYAVVATVHDANYTGSANGTLIISKGSAVVSFTSLSATYDGTPHPVTATTTPAGVNVTVTYNGAATPPTAAGTYNVVATVNDANYSGSAAGMLVIRNGSATVTLGSLSATYDGNPHAATATTTPAGLTVTFTYNGATTAPTAAGSYTVVATVNDPNYSGSATGTLVIAQASTGITFNVSNHVYGDAPFALSASSSSTGAFTYTVLSGAAVINGSTLTITGAGPVTVMASQAAAGSYAAGTQTATFNVAKATLTATVANETRLYGAPNPAFNGAVSGAVYSDSFTESFAVSATPASAPGTYPVAPNVAGATLANYNLNAIAGTLTVTQAPTSLRLTGSSNSITPGQPITFTAVESSTTTGTPTGSVTFYDNGTLLATVTLTAGSATETTTLSPGISHTITVSYTGDTNFLPANPNGSGITVGVAPLDFRFTDAGAASLTVLPGAAVTFSFQIAPTYSVYPGAVSFSVTGLPPGAVASFTPSSLAANGGPATVQMTIQTARTSAGSSWKPTFGKTLPVAVALLLPLLGFGRKRRSVQRLLMLTVLFAGGLLTMGSLTGCGTQVGFLSANTPATYTLTVTTTSGSVTHNQTVTLQVQ